MLSQFGIHTECGTHRRRARRSRHQTHSILHTIEPMGCTEEEEYCDDLTKPRKVHNKPGWKHSQNAVYWIHLWRAQETGIAFWQTKSHAIITNSTVPPECIERVITQRSEMTIYQRSSTPRLAPRIVLKSAWHMQQQQQKQPQDCLRSCGKLQRDTIRGPMLEKCGERGEFVSSRSHSSWSECHKTTSTKTSSGWPRCKIWLVGCKMDIVTCPSSKT